MSIDSKMGIVVVGLNHRTASVALREQLALAGCGLRMALEDLIQQHSSFPQGNGGPHASRYLREAVILSTCNRLEVYAVVNGDPPAGWEMVEQFLSRLQGIPRRQLQPHLYCLDGLEAVQHLMGVASGLDSMILGEPQILGQVASALSEARAASATGPVLSHLFDYAVHAGKRARTETEIGRHTTSVSHAAAQLVSEKLGPLDPLQVLVVGAGDMAEVAASALASHGARHLSFINRTYARAAILARQYQAQALNWYHLPAALITADVVVCATGAPHIVVHEHDVCEILTQRAGRPLLIVDIAVPRDVEEGVGDLPGVRCYDVDDLQATVDGNLAQRRAAVPEVEAIIVQEAQRFEGWLQGRQVLPTLVALRRKAKDIANTELERNQHHFDELAPDSQVKVAKMVHRIVNKLLHEPTVRLKATAAEGNGYEYAYALRELFALKTVSEAGEKQLNNRSIDELSSSKAIAGKGGDE